MENLKLSKTAKKQATAFLSDALNRAIFAPVIFKALNDRSKSAFFGLIIFALFINLFLAPLSCDASNKQRRRPKGKKVYCNRAKKGKFSPPSSFQSIR